MKKIMYTKDGVKVNVLNETADGCYVIEYFLLDEDDYGDEYEYTSKPQVYTETLYEKAPTKVLNGEILNKKIQIHNLSAMIKKLTTEAGELNEKIGLKKVALLPAIENLMLFADNKITHFVVLADSVSDIKLLTYKEFLAQHSDKSQIYITLTGKYDKDDRKYLENHLKESGYWTYKSSNYFSSHVYMLPCTSLTMAKKELCRIIVENYDEKLCMTEKNGYNKLVIKHKLKIKKALRTQIEEDAEIYKQQKIENINSYIECATERIKDYKEDLKKVERGELDA